MSDFEEWWESAGLFDRYIAVAEKSFNAGMKVSMDKIECWPTFVNESVNDFRMSLLAKMKEEIEE